LKLLLDTHALLWALAQPRRLSGRAAACLRDAENSVFVSAASTWEIAIKSALGKLDGDVEAIAGAARSIGFKDLPITIAHTVRLRSLPPHHRDPFDRILAAQAVDEGLSIVTHDPAFDPYDVPTLWN
jgi:PIN domain nuclease of toxin-antitoxin system